jgi:hypothetical protein
MQTSHSIGGNWAIENLIGHNTSTLEVLPSSDGVATLTPITTLEATACQ